MFYKSKKIIFLLTIVFSFFLVFSFKTYAQNSKDAIAIRVMPNKDHLSAARWYKIQGFKGSPQAIFLDGYRGVRDGRTVYLNVANISGIDLYTNIYLISYNQDAEKETVDIFGNILSHWKFNTNLSKTGHCRKNNKIVCMSDKECALGDYCDSLKARVIRDTRRLEDLSAVNFINPPSLDSGSYIRNFSISVWPSWDDALENDLGYALPEDPVNDMGDCAENYDIQTCWDEGAKSFVNDDLSLPDSSMVYTYNYNPADSSAELCGVFESGLTISNPPSCILDVCIDIDKDGYGVFISPECTYHNSGDIDCDDTNPAVLNALEASESTCFGGLDEDCDGFIDCDDSDCEADPFCIPDPDCPDGNIDPGEDCDDNNNINTDDCTNICLDAICGDNIIWSGHEECDDGADGDDTNQCNDDCDFTFCGDHTTQSPNGFGFNEDCDDDNNSDDDLCGNDCLFQCTDHDGDRYVDENNADFASCGNRCGPGSDETCLGYNDCDDSDVDIYPSHAEICDGLDNNCSDSDHSDGVDLLQIDESFSEEDCYWVCESGGYNYNGTRLGDLRCCGDDVGEGNFYEPNEVTCDGVSDNDCDGQPDATDSDCTNICGATEDNTGASAPCNKCDNQHDDDGDQTGVASVCDFDSDGNKDTEATWGVDVNMIDVCDSDCGLGLTTLCYSQYENVETSCDNLDNDCDGTVDNIGQTTCGQGICENTIDDCVAGVAQTCVPLANAVAENCSNGEDDDCDGLTDGADTDDCSMIICYHDSDGDGFGDVSDSETVAGSCSAHYVSDSSDCDDNADYICPNIIQCPETCDGNDNDCDAMTPIDVGCDDDGDGYCDTAMLYFSGASCSEGDCDDTLGSVCPNLSDCPEICDGIDNDCDPVTPIDQGFTDEQCKYVCESGGSTWLGALDYYAVEANYCCGNTEDEQPFENPETSCEDGNDNDCDGDVDCDDDNCSSSSACSTCTFEFTLPCTFP